MSIIEIPVQPVTKQEFLALMDRILPDHYLAPIKNGDGYELFQSFAEMFAQVSQGVADTGKDAQLSTATDGSYSTGTVELYRNSLPASGEAVSGQSGLVASITSIPSPNVMRLIGLTNMSPASVGRFLVVANTGYPSNTGGFYITAYNSPTSVDVVNTGAVAPDTNNGSIVWSEENRTVVVKAGTLVHTALNREFTTQTDVTFLPLEYGPKTVAVQAVARGYEFNVPGQVIAADGTVLEGEISLIRTLIEDPPLLDTGIQVRQLVATTGGTDGTLDNLGNDRGIARFSTETADSYRSRARNLLDTISPSAFTRNILDILRPYNIPFFVIETWDINYQTCWDGPATTILGSNYNPNLCTYDDPRNNIFANRWLDLNDFRGGVIVVVSPVQPLGDQGMLYDDTAMDLNGLKSPFIPGGSRAVCAYDMPSVWPYSLTGAYDGFDYLKSSLYLGLYDTLQRIKPAGAMVAVELLGE